MTTTAPTTRTWTAAVIIDGEALPVDMTGVDDLQDATVAAACEVAAGLLDRTWQYLLINTYKTTAAHGRHVPDRAWEVAWSPRVRRFVARKAGCPVPVANPFTNA